MTFDQFVESVWVLSPSKLSLDSYTANFIAAGGICQYLKMLASKKLDRSDLMEIGKLLKSQGLDETQLPEIFAGLVARYGLQVPAYQQTPFTANFWA